MECAWVYMAGVRPIALKLALALEFPLVASTTV